MHFSYHERDWILSEASGPDAGSESTSQSECESVPESESPEPLSRTDLFGRAATIVCREDSCFFLRVDKEDFNRILRDVEANTVRLKEHGKDVLVLEKLAEPGTTAQFK